MAKRGTRLALLIAAAMFTAQVGAAEPSSREKVPRLRFKDGPVCMCVNGLSESQIQAGVKAREAGANTGAQSAPPAPPTQKEQDQQDAGGR